MAESDLKPTIGYFLPTEWNIKKPHEGSCRATNALTTKEAKVKVNSPVTATSCSLTRKYVGSISDSNIDCYPRPGSFFFTAEDARVEKFLTIIFERRRIKTSCLLEFPVSVLFYINT